MGRWGADDDDPYEENKIDWQSFRPIRPVKKIRVRLIEEQIKPSKQIERVISTALEPPRRKTGGKKQEIENAVIANPDITPRQLKELVDGVSLITLSVIRSQVRKRLKLSRRL
jgi:hypothetical protein